jgi:hypothetical protein
VFILSWERPLYLWASLDSLFRYTLYPHRFVLIDNGSRDPLVRVVIEGFERRGMFAAMHLEPKNLPGNLARIVSDYRPSLGDWFAYVESDVMVEPTQPCWLGEYAQLMAGNPRLAMVGSCADRTDFVSLETAQRLFPDVPSARLESLVKASSPERHFVPGRGALSDPFNPPGRLLLFRTEAVDRVGIRADADMYRALRALGYQAGIANRVRHRHLSFLNAYDYPAYDYDNRDAFFARLGQPEE